MTENEERQICFMKEKSIEAFLLSIEIFNKPTISYRLEGCVYLLCNAWELMLKARLMTEGKSIMYPKSDKKPERSISLSDCVDKVFTNEHDPVRTNLKIVISIRNTATHLIIPEYEIVYMPYLTFSVKAYCDKLYEFFGIDVKERIKSDFLSLYAPHATQSRNTLISKYGFDLVEKLEQKAQSLETETAEGSPIALNVNVSMSRVNKESGADFSFYLSSKKNAADMNVRFIDRVLDPNENYVYTHNAVANKINEIIEKECIPFTPIVEPKVDEKHPNPPIFTTACLDALIKRYKWKEDKELVIKIENGKMHVYKYSEKIITKVILGIRENSRWVVESREVNKKS